MIAAAGRAAVIDIGSNSVRLLLADGDTETRATTVTGLRRGAAADGSIAPDAIERLDRCLTGYAARIAGFRPTRVLAIGTSAVRDAPNADRVRRAVERRLGTRLAVLDGDTEARLALAGARLVLPPGVACRMIDIGGGSTEIATLDDAGGLAAVSLQLGCVRDTEAILAHDPPRPSELAALEDRVTDLVSAAVRSRPELAREVPLVGVAGTLTSLAAMRLGAYDRERVDGLVLDLDTVRALGARLAGMSPEARRAVPGLQPDRAGVIVAGAVIAGAAMSALGARKVVVGERDILDGALAEIGTLSQGGSERAATRPVSPH